MEPPVKMETAPLAPAQAPLAAFHTQDVVRETHDTNARCSSCEDSFLVRYGAALPHHTIGMLNTYLTLLRLDWW